MASEREKVEVMAKTIKTELERIKGTELVDRAGSVTIWTAIGTVMHCTDYGLRVIDLGHSRALGATHYIVKVHHNGVATPVAFLGDLQEARDLVELIYRMVRSGDGGEIDLRLPLEEAEALCALFHEAEEPRQDALARIASAVADYVELSKSNTERTVLEDSAET